MIEIDNTKHDDFLSDEVRSGFGDDAESFGLGKVSKDPVSASPEDNVSAELPTQNSSVEEPISAMLVTEFPALQSSPAITADLYEKSTIESSVEALSPQEDVFHPRAAEFFDISHGETFEKKTSDDGGPSFEEITRELAVAFPQTVSTFSSDLPPIQSLEETTTSNPIREPSAQVLETNAVENPTALPTENLEEEYLRTYHPKEDSADPKEQNGERKVISIPSAEEQRAQDAQYAADQKALHQKTRTTTRAGGIMAGAAFALFLVVLVASGYMLMRKTDLGVSAKNLWAKLSGQSTSASPQDTNSLLLDLTKSSQQNVQQNTVEHISTMQNQDSAANSPQAFFPSTSNSQLPSTQNNASDNSKNSPPIISKEATATKTQHDTRLQATQSSSTLAANTRPTTTTQGQAQKQSEPTKGEPTTSAPIKPKQEKSEQVQSPQKKSEPTATEKAKPNGSEGKAQAPKKSPGIAQSKTQASKQERSFAFERNAARQISGVFAIQVYASPSIADAEEWVERLKRRGMVNPAVSSQIVRGQTMYRVRFGLYNSLQEAERDAARFGYAGSWVVRLR